MEPRRHADEQHSQAEKGDKDDDKRGRRSAAEKPYVALKGGKRRDLTPDELLYLKRTYPSLRTHTEQDAL